MKNLKKSKAQSTVEAALILPILFVLIFGIITIGWWMNVQQIATNAASEAAQVGASSNDNCQIIAAAQGAMKSVVKSVNDVRISIDPKLSADRPPGTLMTVQVSYPLGFNFGFFESSSTSKFGNVISDSVVRLDYYSETGEAKIPSDPQCAGL